MYFAIITRTFSHIFLGSSL